MAKKQIILSNRRQKEYEFYAEAIEFFRCHPVIACEMLLGVSLVDSQAWVLQQSWNTPTNMWTCSRGWGKSFMIAVYVMLKAILYPNMSIYIISKTGEQSKETFTKIEQLATQSISSIKSLTDIFINEIQRARNSNGFIHDPAGYHVTLNNGSKIETLNSKPDNTRGRRANLLVYDESSFIPDELIDATKPFLALESDFVTSTDKDFNIDAEYKKVPNQIIYASSAGDETSRHAKLYKQFNKMMIAGDSSVFSADLPVYEPLSPTRHGEVMSPRIDINVYKQEMDTNPVKALREYHNQFDADGGDEQIVKSAIVRRNEKFTLPQLQSKDMDEHFAIAFDPAHSNDNSIITVMKIIDDPEVGYRGEIVNCMNMVDLNKEKDMNLKFTDQTKILRETLVAYSTGAKIDYEGIEQVLIDAGAGGHGTSYAAELLEEWIDKDGTIRKGIIDKSHTLFKDEKGFMENKNILKLVNPKDKNQMINQMLTLVKSDLITFPHEYNGASTIPMEVKVSNKESVIQDIQLSVDERIALTNIDLLKVELTSMYRYGEKFAISKERRNSVNDDRFDTFVMLAHYLYGLRNKVQIKKSKREYDLRDYLIF